MPINLHDRDCEEEKESEEEKKLIKYNKLFKDLGYEKSHRLVMYYQKKVLDFGDDFNNPKRLIFMKTLKEMKEPYERIFKKDII